MTGRAFGLEPSPDHAFRVAEQLAEAAADRYQEHLAAGDTVAALDELDELTVALERMLTSARPGDVGFAAISLLAATTQQECWMLADDETRREATIRYARAGLGRCDEPDVSADLRIVLASALPESGRDEAIALLAGVLDEIAPGDPLRLVTADLLGHLYYARYFGFRPGDAGPDQADLDAAIAMLTVAAGNPTTADGAGPAGQPDDVDLSTLWQLVLALSERLDARADPADRQALITWADRLTAQPGFSDDDDGLADELAGAALLDRAQELPQTWKDDCDASIIHLKRALATAPDEQDRARRTAMLAQACWTRLNGDDSDYPAVDEMVGYAEDAWRLLPADAEVRVEVGLYLALGIYERLRRPGERFDLAAANLAIDILNQLRPELDGMPETNDLHLMAIVALGTLLVGRGQVTHSSEDALAAQMLLLRAADELPVQDPQWAETAQSLAASMMGLAGMGMSSEHLDRAIDLLAVVADRPGPDRERIALTRTAYGVALIQRAGFTDGAAELDQGIEQLRIAYDLSADGAAERLLAAWNLGSALLTRFNLRGDRQDLDAAEFYGATMTGLDAVTMDAVRQQVADADIVVAAMRAVMAAARGMSGEPALLDDAVERFRAVLAMLPASHPYRDMIRSDFGLALAVRAASGTVHVGDLHEAVLELNAAARALPDGHLRKPYALLRAGGMLASAGQHLGNADLVREAISSLRDAVDVLDSRFGGRPRFAATLGMAYRALAAITSSPADLDAAARWLADACHDLSSEAGHPALAVSLMQLARVYFRQGKSVLASDAGLAALRERGREVMLQSGTRRALGRATAAAAEAAEIASWCLSDARPEAAIEVLELGRGLVLHAATIVTEIPELLASAGQADLAREWREAATQIGPTAPWDAGISGADHGASLLAGTSALEMPSDLRARTLSALAGAGSERLLAPPAPAEIAAALAATEADALIYLVGPQDGNAGQAIIVRADGARADEARAGVPEILALPLLHNSADGVLRDYLAAQSELLALPDDGAAASLPSSSRPDRTTGRWAAALEPLCEWAWPAVMRPVLAHAQQWQLGHIPRLVLVPTGLLSLVPWHAASWRAAGSDQLRYACQDAVVSYAASGRQLIDVSRRVPLPLHQDPVVVASPEHSLAFSVLEAQAIHDSCYPQATYFGYTGPLWQGQAAGPGTASDVLAQLPAARRSGASMIHLGCHANVVGGAPGRSFLKLADGDQLMVEEILRTASGRDAMAPGGLVSLAACRSDLAAQEYDEALTLATAFLAAGAVTVVGARWQVPDGTSSLLMFMLHYFMTAGGHSPRDALRLAQLWMLDPDRRAPEAMPAALACDAGLGSLRDVSAWAAITHQGR